MYSRQPKASHIDTIKYEIDMLAFCFKRWNENPATWDQGDRNVYLECFLLHYRNLIRFFSGRNHREGDLSIADPEPWAGRKLPPPEIAAIQEPALRLEDTYWADISQYLQHCTKRRYEEEKGWDVNKMYDEIKLLLSSFERAFPIQNQVAVRVVGSASDEGSHTASIRRQS